MHCMSFVTSLFNIKSDIGWLCLDNINASQPLNHTSEVASADIKDVLAEIKTLADIDPEILNQNFSDYASFVDAYSKALDNAYAQADDSGLVFDSGDTGFINNETETFSTQQSTLLERVKLFFEASVEREDAAGESLYVVHTTDPDHQLLAGQSFLVENKFFEIFPSDDLLQNGATTYLTITTFDDECTAIDFVSHKIQKRLVDTAQKYLGKSYKMGGESPKGGFDCGHFIHYVYKEAGLDYTYEMLDNLTKNGEFELTTTPQPGDIIGWRRSGKHRWGHVGIVIDDKNFIHAENESLGVNKSSYADDTVWGKRPHTFYRYVGPRQPQSPDSCAE